jgi:hypothetical protein
MAVTSPRSLSRIVVSPCPSAIRRRFKPVHVALQQLEATVLVVGTRAERDVPPEIGQVGQLVALQPVRPPVRVRRLLQPAGTKVRLHQLVENRLRLLGAGQLAGQHRTGQLHHVVVPAAERQVGRPVGRVAADAVGEVVAGCGDPSLVPDVGLVGQPEVLGHQKPSLVDGLHAVAALAVAAFHVVQHRVRTVERHVGELQQRADHRLEVPEQVVLHASVVGRAGFLSKSLRHQANVTNALAGSPPYTYAVVPIIRVVYASSGSPLASTWRSNWSTIAIWAAP